MTEPTTIREVVAVFDNREALENAIEDLQSHGFDRSQISLLASHATVEGQLREPFRDTHQLQADPDAPRGEPLDRTDVGNVAGVAVGAPTAFAALSAAGVAAALTGGAAGIAIAALAAGGGVGALGAFFAKQYNDRVAADLQARSSTAASCSGCRCARRRRRATRGPCWPAIPPARSTLTT